MCICVCVGMEGGGKGGWDGGGGRERGSLLIWSGRDPSGGRPRAGRWSMRAADKEGCWIIFFILSRYACVRAHTSTHTHTDALQILQVS